MKLSGLLSVAFKHFCSFWFCLKFFLTFYDSLRSFLNSFAYTKTSSTQFSSVCSFFDLLSFYFQFFLTPFNSTLSFLTFLDSIWTYLTPLILFEVFWLLSNLFNFFHVFGCFKFFLSVFDYFWNFLIYFHCMQTFLPIYILFAISSIHCCFISCFLTPLDCIRKVLIHLVLFEVFLGSFRFF